MPFSRATAQTRGDGSGSRAPQSLLRGALTNSMARSHAQQSVSAEAMISELDRPLHHPQTEITNDETELNITPEKQSFTPKSFKLGEIVKFPHMVQSLDDKADVAHRIQSSVIQGYICPKVRYAVVVARYAHELVVLPIFSCNKQGVSKKPDAYKATAMSIWNPADQSDATKSLLTEDKLCTNGPRKFYPGSHVNLANIVSVSYNWSIVPAQAQLRQPDTQILLDRFKSLQECGYMSVNQGSMYFKRKAQEQRAKVRADAQSSRPPTIVGQSAVDSTAPARRWAWSAVASGAVSIAARK